MVCAPAIIPEDFRVLDMGEIWKKSWQQRALKFSPQLG